MSTPFGDSGDNGTSFEGSGDATLGASSTDSTASVGQQQQQPQADPAINTQPQANGDSGSGFNPAWNGLLGKIPTQFHPVIAEDLKQWDRNYGQLAQQFAPFKDFVQRGVTPDALSKSYELYQLLNTNPMEIYRRLGEALKDQLPQQQSQLQQFQQQQQAQQQQQPNPNDEYDPDDVMTHPQVRQMQQQLQQMQQYMQQQAQQQQYNAERSRFENEIKTTLDQIEQREGKFDRGEVMRRVAAQITYGQQPNIMQAYQEQKAYEQSLIARNQTPAAPQVMPTNGGIPPTLNVQQKPKTFDERAEKFAELMNLAKQQGS